MVQPLLTTKLFMPQISGRYIQRNELLEKLIADYNKDHQLTLICAPAGYGKSTLVIEFVHSLEVSTAWYSLDEGDNDIQRFLSYLIAVLKNTGVEIGNDIKAIISDTGYNSVETVLILLVNCITEYRKKIIVIFDDFHLIHSPKVNGILKFLLDFQPSNLHLIIITREDPQFPLARLRSQDKLTEIRRKELLFTIEEAIEFFHSANGTHLSNQYIEKINVRTEGWIAGIQLASLLIKGYQEDQIKEFLHKFDGTNKYIIDYLVEEVLEHQEQDIREFLYKTSILEQMNDSLCNELTNRSNSRELLIQMEKKNLFLIPLDDKKEWYRYHHLFADSLRACLSTEEESALYKTSSIWMKEHGFSNEAVRYAFKSKDMQLVIKMVEDTVYEAFQNAQLDTLLEWFDLLPEELIIHNEILSVRKGLALLIVGRWNEGLHYIDSLGKNFEEQTSRHNKGLILMLRTMQANVEGKDAEPIAKEALKFLEPWDPIAIISTLNSLGRAQCRKGNFIEALGTLKEAYESGQKLGYQFVTTLALMNYSSCLHVLGFSEEAVLLCNQYIEGMKKRFISLPPYVGILYVTMADLLTDQKLTEKAKYDKDTGMKLCQSISFDIVNALKLYQGTVSPVGDIKTEEKPKEGSMPEGDIEPEEGMKQKESIMPEGDMKLGYGETLSGREVEILKLLASGLSNKEIADSLFITINTTQWHLSHIYAKLEVKSRTQAILKIKELGLFH